MLAKSAYCFTWQTQDMLFVKKNSSKTNSDWNHNRLQVWKKRDTRRTFL